MARHLWYGCLDGLAKSLCGSGREGGRRRTLEDEGGRGREAANDMAEAARKAGLLLRSSGTMMADGSNCFVSVYSKRGEKGVNQDCSIVWKAYGGQDDMIFLGIFDGHGPWGHFVAKHVRDSVPSSLLCNWQESLVLSSHGPEFGLASGKKKLTPTDVWTQSFLRSCAAVDEELRKNDGFDSVHSGTTALTVVKQGELLITANIGDSRAVLAATDDDGNLTPVQLTYEFKPDLPQEAERILRCQGQVFCLEDEPGVHRLWLPDGKTPGLAMSRAFGDHCMKNFGLISVPEVTQRYIARKDQFLVLATDGVWDVISNQEAVTIVSSTPDKRKSAKRLVERAARAWRHKRQNVALDDCSAICVFFESSLSLIQA